MTEKETKHASKFLSLILRHEPERVGLSLSDAGWIGVDELLRAINQHGIALTLDQLKHIVATSDKKRFAFSEDRLTLVTARRGDFAGRRQIDFAELADRDFVGLTNATALQVHIAKHAARLGLRLNFRARLRDFDAICQLVAADVGVAVVPEAAARRCAASMPIAMIRIRDAWANRRLAICARSFKSLPRPAKLLVEHLRKAAG